jgi:hypothetical protein
MGLLSRLLGTDKAVEGIKNVAESGMNMWDMSTMTAQERIIAFKETVKAMSSEATALSRRHLLWMIIGLNSFAFFIGVMWVALGCDDRVVKLIELVEAFKLGWAFAGAVSFYYLTHIVNGKKK